MFLAFIIWEPGGSGKQMSFLSSTYNKTNTWVPVSCSPIASSFLLSSIFLKFFFYFNFFIFKSFIVVDLQCCDNFCCTTEWFSYTYTHIHSFSFSLLFGAVHAAYGISQARVELELQLLAYPTAAAIQDPSHIWDLYHSLQQCRILDPLSEARDQTWPHGY